MSQNVKTNIGIQLRPIRICYTDLQRRPQNNACAASAQQYCIACAFLHTKTTMQSHLTNISREQPYYGHLASITIHTLHNDGDIRHHNPNARALQAFAANVKWRTAAMINQLSDHCFPKSDAQILLANKSQDLVMSSP